MTRINAFIPPAELSDKHLLAEHREIKRIPNVVYKHLVNRKNHLLEDLPKEFTLGKGHVKFFYDKIFFLYKRYYEIHELCIKKEFDVQRYHDAFLQLRKRFNGTQWNDWNPGPEEILRVQNLIRERINDNNIKSKAKQDAKSKIN